MIRYALILATAFAAVAMAGSNRSAQLAVYPSAIQLTTSRDRATFVVQVTDANGITTDVTADAAISFADDKLIQRDGTTLLPKADGATQMNVSFAGQSVAVPVTVKQADADRTVSFKLDVMPVFMRAGCNTGAATARPAARTASACRCSASTPTATIIASPASMPGRRINLALPAESLLLEKATGKVPHTGGQQFKEGDEHYQTILRWLEAGHRATRPTSPRPVAVEIFPPAAVLDGKGKPQRMIVRAKYSDGTDRDVTHLALFLTNNDTSAKISPDGVVTAGDTRRGVRHGPLRDVHRRIPGHRAAEGPAVHSFRSVPENNYIDTLVNAKLKKLRIAPSEVCTDEAFLRRVYLDIIGTAADGRGVRAVHCRSVAGQARRSWSTSCSTARSSPSVGR